jgi:hypothetical protein
VGVVGQGINWYNSYDISAQPGDRSQGWTGIQNKNWFTVKHDLDMLRGKTNVRFRVAFAADGGANDEGFAFDDVNIGNRTRKVLRELNTLVS